MIGKAIEAFSDFLSGGFFAVLELKCIVTHSLKCIQRSEPYMHRKGFFFVLKDCIEGIFFVLN